MSDRLGAPLVIGTPVAEFEPRPPTVRGYRPDLAADGWSTAGFAVRAASVRGYQHRHDGTPRQDDFALAWHPSTDALVLAVADGVSGADLSHLGATLACRTAVEQLLRLLDGSPAPDPDWREVLRCAGWALVEYAGQQADSVNSAAEWAERRLASTLVAAVVLPGPDGTARALVARVGDSSAWVLDGGGWAEVFGGGAAGGVVTAAVTALPRVPAEVAGAVVDLPAGAVLLVGTDGVGTALGDGTGPVGDALAAGLAGRPSPVQLAHLLDFSRETFDDDRTLVAVWPLPPPEPEPAAAVPAAAAADPTADRRAAAELIAAGLSPEELAIAGLADAGADGGGAGAEAEP